tara:strand:+ start:117 stop:371 length:255 start_codon:yes stop_codon:yes gene_type:complete
MDKQRESVSVTIHKLKSYEDGPIATVRYTEYTLDNKVHSVDQIDYYDITEMNNQILTAVTCGLDVDVSTIINTDLLEKRIKSWT